MIRGALSEARIWLHRRAHANLIFVFVAFRFLFGSVPRISGIMIIDIHMGQRCSIPQIYQLPVNATTPPLSTPLAIGAPTPLKMVLPSPLRITASRATASPIK
jgi:hypothetical protein